MGIRGEIFSTKVQLAGRTYFFNVKSNRVGDLYLNIVESKNKDEGGFDRQSVILFADDTKVFLQGFDEALRVMEKSVREKNRFTTERAPERRERSERPAYTDRSERPPRPAYADRGDRLDRDDRPRPPRPAYKKAERNRPDSRRPSGHSGGKPASGRKLVVRAREH
jgi:hypothetical protein